MLNNTSAAGAPTNVVNSEQSQLILFGPKSASQTSATFTVDQYPYYLSAFNLGNDDVIAVQQVVGVGSGTEVGPFSPIYGQVKLNANRTKCRIDHPGRYQLLHTGSSPLGTFTVIGAAMTMAHDAISDLAEGLYAAVTQQLTFTTGIFPIVVTGTGTTTDPFVVSFAIGSSTSAGTNGHTYYGVGANVSGTSSTAIGSNAAATANGTVALGTSATASATSSVAVGSGSSATGVDGTAVGAAATTTQGTAIGQGANALIGDTALGSGSAATGGDSLAAAQGASATGPNAVALGQNSQSSGNSSIAIGSAANASAAGAGAYGDGSVSSAAGALAIGSGAQATHSNEISVGDLAGVGNPHTGTITIASAGVATNPTQNNQIVLGTATQTQLVTAGSIIQGGVISASDERLKTDIEAEWNALELIERLAPVTFYWDETEVTKSKIPLNADEFSKKQHGLLAQEVEEVLPELVETLDRGAGPYKFVRYERLIPILLAAIQELNEKINELENKQ